jgi:hypothetical protein
MTSSLIFIFEIVEGQYSHSPADYSLGRRTVQSAHSDQTMKHPINGARRGYGKTSTLAGPVVPDNPLFGQDLIISKQPMTRSRSIF